MESFSNNHLENNDLQQEIPPIENPYFFDEIQERGIEREVTKRSLEKVGKPRLSREYSEYAKSIENLLNRKLENNLHEAATGLYHFLQSNNTRDLTRVAKLQSMVKLQNEVTSILSGLEEKDRIALLSRCKAAVRDWTKDNGIDDDLAFKIETSFDGSEAACLYMDRRKRELGDKVEFYSDAFLDQMRSIDLVEFVRNGDETEVRLVQNKTDLPWDEELKGEIINEMSFKHGRWVQYELLGLHDVLDNFMKVIEAEVQSERHKDVRERIGDTYADVAIDIIDVIRGGKSEGGSINIEEVLHLVGKNEISKLALAYAFHKEDGQETGEIEAEAARISAEEDRSDIITSLNITKIDSVLAVNEEVVYINTLYGKRSNQRDLFVGTEEDY